MRMEREVDEERRGERERKAERERDRKSRELCFDFNQNR